MHERYTNRERYFREQSRTTEKYVIPYIEIYKKITSNTSVLEIGCGEGGNMKPFLDRGCQVTGVELSDPQVQKAKEFLAKFSKPEKLKLVSSDIYKVGPEAIGSYDLIIMRDVIEHIHNQEKFLGFVKKFLNPEGLLFIGFPPWQMPFGGHQQVCQSKFLSKTPYFHLLPASMYRGVLSAFGEPAHRIESLAEVKTTGISIERLKRIFKEKNWKIVDESMFFINPNYETKFNIKPRKQFGIVTKIPVIRNFLTTCCYYLVADEVRE